MARAIPAVDEERADLEVLNSNLRKTDEITKLMVKLLAGFDDRLGKMESTMTPIHETTQRLKLVETSQSILSTIKHELTTPDVDSTLAAIQKTKDYWTIPSHEEPIIESSPEKDVAAYLGSIRRLDRGMTLLHGTGDQSSQRIAQKINQLLSTGVRRLSDSWRSVVSDKTSQIEPLSFVMKGQPMPAYSRNQIAFLSAVSQFCNEEPNIEGLRSTIYQDFIKLRSQYMQKSLYTFVLASQRNLEIRTAQLYEKENNGIGHYTEALLRMWQAERSLSVIVFGEAEGLEIQGQVVAAAFSDYSAAVKAITTHVKSRLDTDCYLGFETLENASKLGRSVQDIEMPEVARQLNSIMTNLATVSVNAFFELSEDTKRKASSLATIPMDGAVVEPTKELCAKLRHLVDYPRIVSDLLGSIGDGGWRKPTTSPIKLISVDPAHGYRLLDQYAAEVIETLLQLLEQKSRALNKKLNFVGVFLLNNTSYVRTAIVRSEMTKTMSDKPMTRIEDFNKKAFRIYRESWDNPAKQLMDTTIMRPQDGKGSRNSLSSKDREAAKERFRLFNLEFDEAIKSCKVFVVVDPGLRQSLTSEIRSIIVPLYSRFYDKYINTDFTKNKEKYIKYSKESIEKAVWDAFG